MIDRTWFRAAGLVLAVLVLAACQGEQSSGAGQAPPPPTVTVAKPVVRQVVEEDSYVGRFAAIQDLTVRSRVSGYLEAVHFTDGQLVESGDLLFTIDQRQFQAALAEAEARTRTASAIVDFAQTQFDRAQDLVDRGTISEAVFDQRQEALLTAQSDLDAATAARQQAELNVDFSQINAAVSGRVDRNFISIGNLVSADDTALTNIVSLDPIWFYFDVDERAFLGYARDARVRNQGSLQEGAGALKVTVTLADGSDGTFDGALDFAENRVDNASGTIRLRARFANPDFIMQPGMFGRVSVPGSLPYQGILVPDAAVASDQNRRIVYVLGDDDTVSQRDVRPGPTLFGYRVIRTGLTGDEKIVINGLARIRPGQKVTPKEETLPQSATDPQG